MSPQRPSLWPRCCSRCLAPQAPCSTCPKPLPAGRARKSWDSSSGSSSVARTVGRSPCRDSQPWNTALPWSRRLISWTVRSLRFDCTLLSASFAAINRDWMSPRCPASAPNVWCDHVCVSALLPHCVRMPSHSLKHILKEDECRELQRILSELRTLRYISPLLP